MIALGHTHIGMVRHTNQDVYVTQTFPGLHAALLVICDGMGGAQAGNIASSLALEKFMESVRAEIKLDMSDTYIEDMLRVAAQYANRCVHELSIDQPALRGMGTTLVAALVQNNRAVIINIGDSRAYILRENALEQLTEDHSFVQEMVRKGQLTPEQARMHPHKNLITRAVGADAFADSDLFRCSITHADTLLLCSDGLTGMVDDPEIVQIIENAPTLQQAAHELIHRACENGGLDNITVILFRYDGFAK